MPGSSSADPAPAFESFILASDPLHPLDLAACYPRAQPLHVDLGCGRGDFLAAHGTAHPEINFLGIERLLLRVQKTAKRIAKGRLTNARVLRLEASYTLQRLLPPESVACIYIFFPDPWPKRRHHDRRLLDGAFLEVLNRVLQSDAELHIATDHADYAKAIDKVFAGRQEFSPITAFVPQPHERTQFETEFLQQGLVINRRSFRFTPPSNAAAAPMMTT